MTDQRLRDLERRFAEGDPDAEAPLLVERLRTGTLGPERLRLAAYLGHAPAREALGDEAPRLREDPDSWIRGLADWGPQAWVRAAIAAARLAWSGPCEFGELGDLRVPAATDAAEAWVKDPSSASAEEARAQAEYGNLMLTEYGPEAMEVSDFYAKQFRESRAAVQAALSATDDLRGVTHAVLAGVAARERLSLDALPDDSPMWIRAAEVGRLGELPELTTPEAVAQVRVAVRDALLPWALGE